MQSALVASKQAHLDEIIGKMKDKGEEEPGGEAICEDSSGS